MANNYAFDWSNLAFASKKPLKDLRAIFIAAPRAMSATRFKAVVKTYLPQGDIILGLSKETYVAGYEDQPQFRMLRAAQVEPIRALVNRSPGPHKIYTLIYFQRELSYVIEKLDFAKVVLVNGSWKHVFHSLPAYYELTAQRLPYEMISPFVSETEARDYETQIDEEIVARLASVDGSLSRNKAYSPEDMINIAATSAQKSYDYNFQTGLALGRPVNGRADKYKLLTTTFNKVVPFQSFALHYGASREKFFSPPHDLNHYDTVHAEVMLLIEAQKKGLDLQGTTLFINLMPCPACARMFIETGIAEFVYSIDHSDGYAVQMLEKAGKKVRRVVPPTQPEI